MIFNHSTPLGLPPGSVRAVIVLGLTFTICFVLIKAMVFHEEIPSELSKLLTAGIVALVGLLKDYMAARSDDATKTMQAEIDRLRSKAQP